MCMFVLFLFFCDYIINCCWLMQYIYGHSSRLLHMHYTYLTIWVILFALGQSSDCLRASEVTLKDMIKISGKPYQNATKCERWAHFLRYTMVTFWKNVSGFLLISLIARFMGPTWGPPWSCRTQVDPMLAPWTLLSGILKPVWNVPHFSGNIFQCIFVNKNVLYIYQDFIEVCSERSDCPKVNLASTNGLMSPSNNKVWWLCLVPTSTTRFASDVGYRMAKIKHSCTRKIFFMNNDI